MENKQQTPLQRLIAQLNDLLEINGSSASYKLCIITAISQAESLLPYEREQKIDDYINGMDKGQEIYFGEHKIKLDVNALPYSVEIAEQYYTETYGE